MASRENQGLQIAVIIFFVMVVVLGVMTYVFFKQSTDLNRDLAAKAAEYTTQENNLRVALSERDRLKAVIGFTADVAVGAEESPEAGSIMAEVKKDMDAYSVGFKGAEKKAYRNLLEYLHKQCAAKETDLAKALEENGQVKAALAAAEGAAKGTYTAAITEKDQKLADFEDQRGKFNEDREKQTSLAKTALDEKKEIEQKVDDLTADFKAKEKKLATEKEKLAQINEELRSRQKQTAEVSETPDGHITWVNQRTNTVWVNLGSDDMLQRQMAFAIYGADESKLTDETKKGTIEITRVLDRHTAEARILNDEVSNPILPGDSIATAAWSPGKRDQFVLLGFMDIDGDGKSDREKVKQLIHLHNGEIVCELADDGKVTGKIELTTRFLITGDPPTGKDTEKELLDNFTLLSRQASELGIDKVPFKRFLSQMGFTPDERTVTLGRAARSKDFPAKAPDGVQHQSTGETSDAFKKRNRPKNTF